MTCCEAILMIRGSCLRRRPESQFAAGKTPRLNITSGCPHHCLIPPPSTTETDWNLDTPRPPFYPFLPLEPVNQQQPSSQFIFPPLAASARPESLRVPWSSLRRPAERERAKTGQQRELASRQTRESKDDVGALHPPATSSSSSSSSSHQQQA
ncbi:hypothetical protein SCAR479_06238 [Seiridium cardinale]|uniref:Uncharacterized protein n=1 Tax=Seiridium cardinale TaxID=138064 RepID=A0ABR2XTZ6_9PEZI